jgi:hypothetical protein
MGGNTAGAGADIMSRPNITVVIMAAITTGTAGRSMGPITVITTDPRLFTIMGRTVAPPAGRSIFTISRFIIPIIIPSRSAGFSSRQRSVNRDLRWGLRPGDSR